MLKRVDLSTHGSARTRTPFAPESEDGGDPSSLEFKESIDELGIFSEQPAWKAVCGGTAPLLQPA